MDKYVFLVILLAPGFIASTTSTFCGNQPNKNSEFGFVIRYFSYSFFSLLVTLLFCVLFGLIGFNESLETILTRANTAGYSIAFLLTTVFSAVLTGAGWSLVLRHKYLKLFNYLTSKKIFYSTNTYTENTTLEHLFLNNELHFVTVEQDGKELSIGFIDCVCSTDEPYKAISVEEHPGYRKWMEDLRAEGKGMEYCKKTYIDFDSHIVIREFYYPSAWTHYEE